MRFWWSQQFRPRYLERLLSFQNESSQPARCTKDETSCRICPVRPMCKSFSVGHQRLDAFIMSMLQWHAGRLVCSFCSMLFPIVQLPCDVVPPNTAISHLIRSRKVCDVVGGELGTLLRLENNRLKKYIILTCKTLARYSSNYQLTSCREDLFYASQGYSRCRPLFM